MLRIIGVTLLGLVLLAVVLLVIALVALPPEVANEYSSRSISDAVLWGGGEVDVTLALPPLPVQTCEKQARPLDIVLLIDTSGSMEGEPLRQAIAAADQFIQMLDLSTHRVAVIFFSNRIESTQHLTDQPGALRELLDTPSSGGGTAIDVGLRAGREELTSSYNRAEAQGFIVLLSDGGSKPPAALYEAELATQQGIWIATVGLLGDDFNERLLQQLATSGIYRLAQTPDDLIAIYEELGTEINRIVATDLVVWEPINRALQIDPGSVHPPANSTASGLAWHQDWLTETSNIAFSYRAHVDRFGIHGVVTDTGEIRFNDCTGAPIRFESPKGPHIFVLHPLPLIVLPLLALLGLFLLLLGRKEPEPTMEEMPPPVVEPTPPPIPIPRGPSSRRLFQEWLQNAESLAGEEPRVSPAWLRERPVLFIGLGFAGEQVLSHVVNYLRGRCGEDWAEQAPHVRLLQIDVSEREGAELELVQTTQGYSKVTVGLGSQRRRRLTRHKGMQWITDEQVARPTGRALGRLALFANLIEGKNQSRLWSALVNTVGDLMDLSVYVVADGFSDEVSGIIADTAHLLKASRQGQISRIALCLTLQNAKWPDRLTSGRRNERVFATIRELQRLQRKSPVVWNYAPGLGQAELDDTHSWAGPLFDEILFFDGLGEGTYDISRLSPKDALLPSIAGCLISLLDRETSERFYEFWQNEVSVPMRQGRVPWEFVVGSMGSYALRLPIEEMRRIVEARIVHKLLFDRLTGLIGFEDLTLPGEPERRGEIQPPEGEQVRLEDFWRERGITARAASRLNQEELYKNLFPFLEQRLNQTGAGQIRWAQEFVVKLQEEIPSQQAALKAVERSLQAWVAAVGESEEPQAAESEDLLTSFLGMGTETGPTTSPSKEVHTGPLYHAWEQEWERSRSILDVASRMHAQDLFWKLEDEGDLFKKHILPDKPWERMQRRIWWRFFDRGAGPELCLLVLPHELDLQDPREYRTTRQKIERSAASYFLTVAQAERVLDALLDLTRAFSRRIKEQSLQFHLQGRASYFVKELEHKATPLCRRRYLDPEKWRVPLNALRYFAGPELQGVTSIAEAFGEMLGGTKDAHFFHPVHTNDPTECRLLHVKHILPSYATDAYAMAQSSYTPKAELHVWQEEQIATAWEDKGQKKLSPRIRDRKISEGGSGIYYSPHMVELIAQEEENMRLFGQSLIYGILQLDTAALEISTNWGTLENLRGRSFIEAAEIFLTILSKDRSLASRIASTVESRQESEEADRHALLDEIRQTYVRPLSERDEIEAQDAALLLAAVLTEEQRIY